MCGSTVGAAIQGTFRSLVRQEERPGLHRVSEAHAVISH